MSRWRRTVPALLFLLFMSMPLVYFQLGNLVYTQAAATNLECSGHSARNSPDDFSVKLWNEDIEQAMFEKNETLAGNLSHLWFDAWENCLWTDCEPLIEKDWRNKTLYLPKNFLNKLEGRYGPTRHTPQKKKGVRSPKL